MSDAHFSDVMDHLLGAAPNSPLAELRRQRSDVVGHMQASDSAILRPMNDAGLSHAERAAVALRIATSIKDPRLADYYRSAATRLDASGRIVAAAEGKADGDARFRVILEHADRLTADPDAARPEHLAQLADAGLSNRAIVGLSQVIAYVNYQARVFAGLRMLGGVS